MISLKKNDKIIIIVAVVVLVIAGVGVAMYQSPKTSNVLPSTITGEKTFDVIWTIRNGTLDTISEFAGKKSPYEGTVMIPEGNVKSITFNLSWTDDHMTFLKRMGLDTLTLEVTTPDGVTFTETNKSAPITGEGTITYDGFSWILSHLLHQLKQTMRKMHKENSKRNHITMTPGPIKTLKSMSVCKSVNSVS